VNAMSGGSEWCTIESDPGVFTELIGNIGVKGIQVEELYDMEPTSFARLKPVYGLIFLFKWQKDELDKRPIVRDADGIFFARQVVTNACATQAIISVLLNRPEIDLGKVLSEFKSFAIDLPPDIRGMAIGNTPEIRKAHNSFARPEPLVFEEKKDKDDEDDDAFHFIGYVPVDGAIWELDGLKAGPIKVADCTLDNWLDKVKPAIEERIHRYSSKEVRFNLLALVGNRADAMQKEIATLEAVPEAQRDATAIAALKEDIRREEQKFATWKTENVRRRHNYVPFIYNLIKLLAEKGKVKALVDAGGKAATDRAAKRAEEKKKEDERRKAATAAAKPAK